MVTLEGTVQQEGLSLTFASSECNSAELRVVQWREGVAVAVRAGAY